MKVSIITIVLNGEATIEETICSVKQQDYDDIEYIIIDGGSSDGTLDVIRKHGDVVDRLVSESDEGEYDAMNKGVRLATGDLIGILCADDAYAHRRVISQVVAAMERSGVEALYADVSYKRPGGDGKTLRRYSSRRFRPALLSWGFIPAHPTLFLRRSVYEKYGEYCAHYDIAGDYEFMARIFWNTGLSYEYMPEVLVVMKTGGKSTRMFRNGWRMNKEVLQACRENGIGTNGMMIYSKYARKIFELFGAGLR